MYILNEKNIKELDMLDRKVHNTTPHFLAFGTMLASKKQSSDQLNFDNLARKYEVRFTPIHKPGSSLLDGSGLVGLDGRVSRWKKNSLKGGKDSRFFGDV